MTRIIVILQKKHNIGGSLNKMASFALGYLFQPFLSKTENYYFDIVFVVVDIVFVVDYLTFSVYFWKKMAECICEFLFLLGCHSYKVIYNSRNKKKFTIPWTFK